ncbi:MAG: site-specific DNA-methyltransferase [Ignavibacteriales bacterium]|nr:MAG: site-specific DNA-methyltransferase [Ignavibacteriaceae bacterium]MBW7873365.1 site-specific DNA-methyltransferase [Ignavibacteria bacterium]MCZ2142055.1 site-specific DNA-methyltransferase [Ignavibacteriales bacterium]OQY70888.1 MAG: hypothetical protein B6D45_10740 [Ignavibacteriales bacterium UTCHB3]MBV6444792.1 hypothetical protein [Ignavibacteriaceae bacterium]
MNEIEKFSLESMNIKEEQLAKLKLLFPEVFTEGNKIDWVKLKLTLGENIDDGRERFGLTWAGKSDCFKIIQQPSTGTLVPDRDESVNFDETENLFIEGDNLEVLKLLQKSYFGKVKMIYIDPPYNTGNDFVYKDNFKDNLSNYLSITGQSDAEGRKLTTNQETDGRFHSNWLNMMYPRLFLAKNLLREDGVIFISIDDHEVHNLRGICNEIFGEENLLACITWQRTYAPIALKKHFSESHEYLLTYARDVTKVKINPLPRSEKQDKDYKNPDKDPRGPWKVGNLAVGPPIEKQIFDIITPSGRIVSPPNGYCWRFTRERFEELKLDGRIWFGQDGNNVPAPKIYLSEVRQGVVPMTFWNFTDVGHNQEATRELRDLMGELIFDNPKPKRYLKRILQIGLSSDGSDIVLDFFAGSCTISHAIMELNHADDGNRKFICVQLPELTDEKSSSFKTNYKTIAEIGKERIRRVIKKIKDEKKTETPRLFKEAQKPLDLGFKVFKLQESNFSTWDTNVEKTVDALTEQLFRHIDHISPEAAQEAILYELLIKSGFELTTKIDKIEIEGKTVFSIMDNTMLICLERDLTLNLLKAIAELKPVQFICLDEGFRDNDQLKSNAVLLMRQNGILKFQTV